jgi:uncharacterized protein YciI
VYYAIFAKDRPDSLARRLEVRPQHLERIQALVDEGRVLVAGPHPAIDAEDPGSAGFSGSLIVAEFDCVEDAEQWISEDPYVTAGVFEGYRIKPFKRVFP